MPLRNFLLLLQKEWHELLAARAFWFLLLFIGPLVGHSFITAMTLYAEASGIGGGPAALSQGLTPLDGILVPTFGAYDLAATFLFPFLAIRFVSAEKQSGALKLLLQLPGSLGTKLAAKNVMLFGAWLIALVPGLLAVALWKVYGGHLYLPETLNLLLGHWLRMMISGSLAMAAAALLESASSAAIVTLTLTIGTWALDFVAANRGGWLQELAAFTPTAALRFFEHGLLRISTLAVMIAIGLAGICLAVIWLDAGRTVMIRIFATVPLLFIFALLLLGVGRVRTSWDLSENRRNSFSREDEAVLRQLPGTLVVTVFLAPEDPRLTDFEQNVVRKLRRTVPHLVVDYTAGGRMGLFEANADQYGEIWYEMNGQKVMERSTIEPIVLEQIYRLAQVSAPPERADNQFPGYPLAVGPRGAAGFFYGLWPLLTLVAWWITRR